MDHDEHVFVYWEHMLNSTLENSHQLIGEAEQLLKDIRKASCSV